MKLDSKKENFVECPVKVGVCICPLTEEESAKSLHENISFTDNEVKVSMGEGKGNKTYEVDHPPFYFGTDPGKRCSSLDDVCNSVGKCILDDAFSGYNSTLFTFGAKVREYKEMFLRSRIIKFCAEDLSFLSLSFYLSYAIINLMNLGPKVCLTLSNTVTTSSTQIYLAWFYDF